MAIKSCGTQLFQQLTYFLSVELSCLAIQYWDCQGFRCKPAYSILNSVLQKAHETCNVNTVCAMTKGVLDAWHTHIVCHTLGLPCLNHIVDENAEDICPFSTENEIMHHFHFCSLSPKPQVKIQLPIWKSEGC